MDEPVPGYPKPPAPRDKDAAKALKNRTLTNLCNRHRQSLAEAHAARSAAVAAAIGWSANMSEDDVLRQFQALNSSEQ